jgi:DNA replication ATP-dependent helicase Dna2
LLISAKNEGLELSTIDKFQGRDKDAVIVSFVRSNQNGRCGRLLADYRRLNVALSRARKKLIMIGSTQTLAIGNSVLAPLLDRMKEKRWIEALPENVTDVYI